MSHDLFFKIFIHKKELKAYPEVTGMFNDTLLAKTSFSPPGYAPSLTHKQANE